MRHPLMQLRPPPKCGPQLNLELQISKRRSADLQKIKRLPRDECHNLRLRLRPTQLRQSVGIEQPTRHKLTSRTGSASRLGARSSSRAGEACIAATSAAPVNSPFSRRNSSAEITTTSARPCTIICCGPSLLTCRTNLLNRALASCSNQYPGRSEPRERLEGGGAAGS